MANKRLAKLTALVIFADDAEKVAYNTLLPIYKVERNAAPFAFGMFELVAKMNRNIREFFFIHGCRCFESAGFVIF